MAREIALRIVNSNPSRFEELVSVLAAISSYVEEGRGVEVMVDDFQHLYNRALGQPPGFAEVNELTGQSLNAGDRMSGRAAWMLSNLERLEVWGVHSLLWHEVQGVHKAPLLEQMATALGVKCCLTNEDLRHMATDNKAIVDVVGVKGCEAIWIVQTITKQKRLDSAISRTLYGSNRLFKSRIFGDFVLAGQPLKTLCMSNRMMRRAFPRVPVFTFCLVQHPDQPDFELYQVEIPSEREPATITLTESMIRTNSIDYVEMLREDYESLLTLPRKLDNDLFRGIPPCRGGRTLNILASTAKRQLLTDKLLVWKERDVVEMLAEDFDYIIPRDKVRHDLGDRLASNGFMRKFGSEYSLTVKGMARYLYCLAKYTTKAVPNPMDVLEECKRQRNRILNHYHCL